MALGSFASFLLPVLCGIVICVGMAIIVRGLVGRPRWHAPVCASCGHGVAIRSESVQHPCPECGGVLSAAEAIRYFRRERRFLQAFGGGMVIVGGLFLIGLLQFLVYLFVTPRVSSTTAASQLAQEIENDTIRAWVAVKEATDRLQAGRLNDDELRAIARAIIGAKSPGASESQSAVREPFDQSVPPKFPKIGEPDLLIAARNRSLISDDDLVAVGRTYGTLQQLSFPTTFRPPLHLGINWFPPDTMNAFKRSAQVKRVELNGVPFALKDYQGNELPAVTSDTYGLVELNPAPGRHELKVTFAETFVYGPDLQPTTLTPITVAADRVETIPITVVDRDAPTWITTTVDNNRRKEVEGACVVRGVAIDQTASGDALVIRADFEVLPVKNLALAFRVLVRIGDEEYKVGSMVALSGTNFVSTIGPMFDPARGATVALDPPSTVTVIFRPEPELAEAMQGVTSVWGDEVRQEGIPVRTNRRPHQPRADQTDAPSTHEPTTARKGNSP